MATFSSRLHLQVQEVIDQIDKHPLPLLQTGSSPLAQANQIEKLSSDVLFPEAGLPQEALAGLLLLLRSWQRGHEIAQDLPSREGSYWHAIAHRLEPDEFNSQYWFRRVGQHPIFEALHAEANAILQHSCIGEWQLKEAWSPRLFGRWCEEARANPNGEQARVATAIQGAEWKLLFGWCLQPSDEPI